MAPVLNEYLYIRSLTRSAILRGTEPGFGALPDMFCELFTQELAFLCERILYI